LRKPWRYIHYHSIPHDFYDTRQKKTSGLSTITIYHMIFMTQAETVENFGGIFTIKGQKLCRQESKKSSVCDL